MGQKGVRMNWPDAWQSSDGLAFVRDGVGWRVDIVRTLPQRLGEPVGVELPLEGKLIGEGDTLLAIELSKARVEFAAPAAIEVCESRNLSDRVAESGSGGVAWLLVIRPRST